MANEEEKPASSETEKLDIEDIKDPLEETDPIEGGNDLDIEEVVAEDDILEDPAEAEPKETVTKSNKSTKKEKNTAKVTERETEKKKEPDTEKDILEIAKEEQENTEKEEKPKKVKRKGSFLKTFLIIFLTVLVTSSLVLGGVYLWLKKTEAPAEEVKTEVVAEEKTEETPEKENQTVYVNSSVGLNLRKEPLTTAEILAIIPSGTKLEVLEEKEGWIKTKYEGKEGWVSKEYTSDKNPLVYSNETYGFSFTFPATWSGYEFVKKTMDGGSIAFYVGLSTIDKNWTDPSDKAGFGSLFAVDVYTKEQWAAAQAEEGPKSAKLGEKGNYVFAWMPGQAAPSDLEDRYDDVKGIIATFLVN